MGSIMLDVSGYEITPEEKELLEHPFVGGVIYFTRNFHDPDQLTELVRQTREASRSELVLAVDHEGGRVQRFRDGFSAIPAMAEIEKRDNASEIAKCFGHLMAAEVLASGIDISFAPVLDVNGISDVIGDRSFSGDPRCVETLATSFIEGMRAAGMKVTGKHFPGHGSVKEDSHIALPVDKREREQVLQLDAQIFKTLISNGKLDAVMPAHVIYSAFDELPAGFSPFWLKRILREQMQFNGVIFSDDLAMHGALHLGKPHERAVHALTAGCDVALICNDREAAVDIIDNLPQELGEIDKMQEMRGNFAGYSGLQELVKTDNWMKLRNQLDVFNES